MSPNIRRNIAKAKEKYHITVKKGISIDDFLRIQSLTFKRQHLPSPKHCELLKKLIATFANVTKGTYGEATMKKGNLHAAAFVVWQESSAYYLAGGGDPDLRESGAPQSGTMGKYPLCSTIYFCF